MQTLSKNLYLWFGMCTGACLLLGPSPSFSAPATEENADFGQQLQAERPFEIGGALRFNYSAKRSDADQRDRGGDAVLELFRFNIEGEQQGIDFSAEYRWYSYQDVLHHGWAGFAAGDDGQFRFGISQVPFGILPFAAHNYWFGIPHYVGLGDSYKLGAQYIYGSGPWDLRAAFFKNPAQADPDNYQRYGFDVVNHVACGGVDADDDDAVVCTREANQANLRLAYTFGDGGFCPKEFGISGQWGQLPNAETGEKGSRWAAAAHMDVNCGRWNLQLQAGRQVIDLNSTQDVDYSDTATFGGFSGSHQVASEANLGVANIAYNFPVPWENLDSLTCYNDFSIYDKDKPGFSDSMINTSGCSLSRGPLFIYADVIRAQNAPFLGSAGEGIETLGKGNAGWDTLYNLNLGYYF